MAVSNDYLQYVLEQLAGLGHVVSRRMFGAVGLYCDDFFFGLLDNDTLYFKVGDSNRADYEARGMARFRPFPDKPHLSMTYYEVPADALEDAEELRAWARKSLAVAAETSQRGKRRERSLTAREGKPKARTAQVTVRTRDPKAHTPQAATRTRDRKVRTPRAASHTSTPSARTRQAAKRRRPRGSRKSP